VTLVGDEHAVRRAIDSGAAYERFQRWVAAQGGDPEAPLPRAPLVVEVPAPRSGVVQRCHARPIGEFVMRMGAGRSAKDLAVDHAVGVLVHRKRGDRVEAGQPLATVHARRDPDLAAVAACFEIGDDAVDPEPLLLGDVRA
jgi:thymidine phosphorylase